MVSVQWWISQREMLGKSKLPATGSDGERPPTQAIPSWLKCHHPALHYQIVPSSNSISSAANCVSIIDACGHEGR